MTALDFCCGGVPFLAAGGKSSLPPPSWPCDLSTPDGAQNWPGDAHVVFQTLGSNLPPTVSVGGGWFLTFVESERQLQLHHPVRKRCLITMLATPLTNQRAREPHPLLPFQIFISQTGWRSRLSQSFTFSNNLWSRLGTASVPPLAECLFFQ